MISLRSILAFTAFLSGCTGVQTPAGPTCVSCKPYFVRGSWHYPQTYYEYNETGLASWYGNDCHGKPKATGEKFNMFAMTAAHKTLPIPSVVKVTNLNSGKSIVVVIDDRGPFCYKGRIIDLSYAAAKALDIHNRKPSPVRVETLVSDSLKLSIYISQHCKKRKDPFGRTWAQIYFQEIAKVQMPVYKGQNKKAKTTVVKKVAPSKKKRYNSLGNYLSTKNI